MISYIVSAFERPNYLRCCLASLALQQSPKEIIIADNSHSAEALVKHQRLAEEHGCLHVHTSARGGTTCYDAAEIIVPLTTGDWLCFPSDDSYYVPAFAGFMLATAIQTSAELVYCDMIYDPRLTGQYAVMNTSPRLGQIDKTNFILRKDKFIAFPGKVKGGSCAADGLLIDELCRQGITHAKAPGVLCVHN